MIIPSEKVTKWGPLAGTCLKYAAGAASVLPVGGSLAKSACSAAAEYVDRFSDAEGKQALEGMEPGEKQELVGWVLCRFWPTIRSVTDVMLRTFDASLFMQVSVGRFPAVSA